VARMPSPIQEIVARNLYKLMAYKDEYEVARLLTKSGYEGVTYNLHPPLLREMGLRRKIQLGPWFRPFLKLLASLKPLRGGALDIFGRSSHRREERELVGWYRHLIETNLDHPGIAELAGLPDAIRGYDEIKSRSIAAAKQKARELCELPAHSSVS
jgi:indolepyruvate ferredoxin oxidoreductase